MLFKLLLSALALTAHAIPAGCGPGQPGQVIKAEAIAPRTFPNCGFAGVSCGSAKGQNGQTNYYCAPFRATCCRQPGPDPRPPIAFGQSDSYRPISKDNGGNQGDDNNEGDDAGADPRPPIAFGQSDSYRPNYGQSDSFRPNYGQSDSYRPISKDNGDNQGDNNKEGDDAGADTPIFGKPDGRFTYCPDGYECSDNGRWCKRRPDATANTNQPGSTKSEGTTTFLPLITHVSLQVKPKVTLLPLAAGGN